MNTVTAQIDASDYEIYDDDLNFRIDGYWLDEHLEKLYPNKMYKGLISTLTFGMEVKAEEKVVWDRILPDINSKSVCPILMCPDDCDFSCTIIVAEIENCGDLIRWNRLGVDKTEEFEANKIGTTVEWFQKVEPYKFSQVEYQQMLDDFRKQYASNRIAWQEREN